MSFQHRYRSFYRLFQPVSKHNFISYLYYYIKNNLTIHNTCLMHKYKICLIETEVYYILRHNADT